LATHALRGNQVSFFLGELVIRHGCNPFPGRMRRQPVSPAPHLLQRKLHLLCESATPNHSLNWTARRRRLRVVRSAPVSLVQIGLATHALRGNQVSFFLGELVIRHGCNPFPGRMRRQPVSPAPHLLQRKLHLLCESATPNHSLNWTARRRRLRVVRSAPVSLV